MKLLYLSLLSFVFISSTALALSTNFVSTANLLGQTKNVINPNLSPLPTLGKNVTFPILSAQAVLAIDSTSGVTLYEKDPDKHLLPASTTKIVTALVAMDYYPNDLVLKVGKVKVAGQKMGLKEGEEIKIEDLLYGLLVYSANDAAEVLAQNYPGGREMFISAMNLKAKKLNLTNTLFTNPAGLDGEGLVITARDLATVSLVAMQNPEFAKIVATKEKTVKSVDNRIIHRLININELLGKIEGVVGVKTGWTENARENLVTYIERKDSRGKERKIMIVLLASQDRFGETRELIDWIFDSYDWREVRLPG